MAEKALFEKVEQERVDANIDSSPCVSWLHAEYAVYNFRYPDFGQAGAAGTRFRAWKTHIMLNPRAWYLIRCISTALTHELFSLDPEMDPPPHLTFCGSLARPARPYSGQAFDDILYEMLDYIDAGILHFVDAILMLNQKEEGDAYGDYFDLDPQLEYYLIRVEQPYRQSEEHPPRDVWHVQTRLNEADLAFLEDAVARSDLQSVLGRIEPCKLRFRRFDEKQALGLHLETPQGA